MGAMLESSNVTYMECVMGFISNYFSSIYYICSDRDSCIILLTLLIKHLTCINHVYIHFNLTNISHLVGHLNNDYTYT